jgi:hypothetical protein
VRVHVKNSSKRERLSLAVGAMRKDGTLCFAHATQFAGLTLDFAEGHVTLLLDTLRLLSGEFGVSIWLFDETGRAHLPGAPGEAEPGRQQPDQGPRPVPAGPPLGRRSRCPASRSAAAAGAGPGAGPFAGGFLNAFKFLRPG